MSTNRNLQINKLWTVISIITVVLVPCYILLIGPMLSYGQVDNSRTIGIGALLLGITSVILSVISITKCYKWLKIVPILGVVLSLLLTIYGWIALTFVITF